MYKLRSIEISGFWHRHSVKVNFNDEVNVIIGRNGTGKTTFMNILQGVLAVDLDALQANQFESATIVLVNDAGQKKTIKATKLEEASRPYAFVEYKISNRKYMVLLLPVEDRNRQMYVRRKVNEETATVRNGLKELISLASLSVYRMRNVIESDARERTPEKRFASPVDARLAELTQQLTHYQLELSQQAQEVSIDLQKQVLTSLLYEKEKNQGISLNFVGSEEKLKLVQAYTQLGVTGSNITKRINEHVTSIEETVKNLKENSTTGIDFATFEAKRRTDKVVKLSLAAGEKTKEIYSQINLFIELINSFINDKKFSFVAGDLRVKSDGPLPLEKLSSGEKQLLILLIEAVLQRQQPYVFLADEPELSLHIAWQKRIVPAVKKMNPNAQVVVATHSPEIAGRYAGSTIDMEDMIHGAA